MITSTRQYSLLDKMIMEVDVAARTLLGQVASNRENPANMVEDSELTERERAHSAGLMRVDHAGEGLRTGLVSRSNERGAVCAYLCHVGTGLY